MLQLEGLHQVLNYAEFEADGNRKVLAVKVTSKIDDLQNQALHRGRRQPGIRQGFRLFRSEVEFCGHAAHSHIEFNLNSNRPAVL